MATRASIGADKTTTFQQRYPRAGTANAKVDLFLVNPDGSGMVKADLGPDPDIYLARVDWLPDGQRPHRPAREPRPEEARPYPHRCEDRHGDAAADRSV